MSGAEIAASLKVVKNEFHAVPAQTMPHSPHCRSNAERKCASVGVQSRPQTCTKPPANASA